MLRRVRLVDRRAEDALILSLVGIVFCGPVLQPMAAARAAAALREHREQPDWRDRWKAVAALAVASLYGLVLLGWLAFIFAASH
jgi:hypothetical protein